MMQLILIASLAAQAGTLANPGFEGQPMKSVYFFAGQWRFPGPGFYDGPVPGVRLSPAANDCLYTIFPVDGAAHLGWSENREKRAHAVNLMLATGVNVVNMSYWGQRHTDRWAFWAPMQSAVGAHDELFDAAVGRPLLVAPYIESGAATIGHTQIGCHGDAGPVGESAGYNFLDTFPGTFDDPAPALVEQIVDLVNRYLLKPANPAWRGKWARMYDSKGQPRYVVSLIHVGSNQPGVSDETFAKGFGWVAERVYRQTGVRVGFTLDALPPQHDARFKPSPARTGRWLARQPSVLAIQPFIPEVHTRRCAPVEDCDSVSGSPSLAAMIAWKQRFVSDWVSTGIPVILDVSAGRDARRVFPDPREPRYGNNVAWRDGQKQMLSLGVRGITGNTWNGYTEGFAIVPACVFSHEDAPPGLPLCGPPPVTASDATYLWFRQLIPPGGSPARHPTNLAGESATGTYSDPVALSYTLTEALTGAPVAGREVHFRIGKHERRATTNAAGVARASITLDQRPGVVSLLTSFDGDAEHLSFESSSNLVVNKETTAIRWFGDVGPAFGTARSVTLSAVLDDDDARPVRKRSVTFIVGSGSGAQKCTGVTGTDGVARCRVDASKLPRRQTVYMTFTGDDYYEPAAAKQEVTL
jgi:hypothetical protein